jgi:uncharacterized protein YcgI (DUF1989 family)
VRATTITIEAASAKAFDVPAGWRFRVTDPDGCQVGDLFCVSRADPGERFSQARTRVYLQRLSLRPGDRLWSTRDRPLLALEEDTVGVHDLLFCGCSAYVFETFLDAPGKTGCLDHLADALAPHGVARDAVEAPLDLFMATEVRPDGTLAIHRSPSRPGDHVVLRAETDLVVALAACADDVTACNGGRCGPLLVDLAPPAPEHVKGAP